MADMGIVINRHAADVHLDDVRFESFEIFFFASESVIQADHALNLPQTPALTLDSGMMIYWINKNRA